mmetsp:Transcript_7944/g.28299  ORF Transcript_7944/g.28299 Transcript_7944/m.28299 type:complete len:214 (-) Transcript_7944:657-1298(-)
MHMSSTSSDARSSYTGCRPRGVTCASISATTRAHHSGLSTKLRSIQSTSVAVVSCPARKNVITSSITSSVVMRSPVSSSRAASSRPSRSFALPSSPSPPLLSSPPSPPSSCKRRSIEARSTARSSATSRFTRRIDGTIHMGSPSRLAVLDDDTTLMVSPLNARFSILRTAWSGSLSGLMSSPNAVELITAIVTACTSFVASTVGAAPPSPFAA